VQKGSAPDLALKRCSANYALEQCLAKK